MGYGPEKTSLTIDVDGIKSEGCIKNQCEVHSKSLRTGGCKFPHPTNHASSNKIFNEHRQNVHFEQMNVKKNKKPSSVKLCTDIFLHSEAQTLNCGNKAKNTFLTGGGL